MTVGRTMLGSLGRPFIVGVITDRIARTAASTMTHALDEGADAFEINLPALAGESAEALARLFRVPSGPAYTSCRRRAFMTAYGLPERDLPDWSDDERMRRQLALVAAGSLAVDIELDTFDPHPAPPLGSAAGEAFAAQPGGPAELSLAVAAVRRQREVAADAKAMGAEALFSCHTGRPQAVDGLLAIGRAAVDRGADLLKIVTPCRDRADLSAVLDAAARLAAELPIPFTLIGAGDAGRVSRLLGAELGCAWLIGRPARTTHGFAGQPLVADLRRVVDLLGPPPDRAARGRPL